VKAAIVAVGSELLAHGRDDTNGPWLTGRLRQAGIPVVLRLLVDDHRGRLAEAFRLGLAESDLVIATGGLGPTEDDLTREAAAAALGVALRRDTAALEAIRARFARFGRPMAPVNEKQADVLEGGEVLANSNGTAPGQWFSGPRGILALLPGPPREMMPLFETAVLPRLQALVGARVLRTRVLRIAGMGESEVEQIAAPVYATWPGVETTILAGPAEVELHLTAEGATEGEALGRVVPLAEALQEALLGRVASDDGRSLPEVVGGLLVDAGLSLAIAESCTGGLLSSRLTEVPGSSRFFDRGFVTYSNESKTALLGVDPELVARHGAVSVEVARAMAAGARRAASAGVAVAITGIAGPDGGTPDKPVGLVCFAVETVAEVRVRRSVFPGDRDRVRRQAVAVALEMIRRVLLGLED